MTNKNPYALLRERAGYTLKRFCLEFKFAKQTVIGIESGMYPELSERMTDAITQACYNIDMLSTLLEEYDTPYLSKAYEAWRIKSRRVLVLPTVELHYDALSPMHYFVKDTIGSVQGFAKKLKVPPATLLRYIRGDQKFMPMEIKTALQDAGCEQVNELEQIHFSWINEK